MGGTWRTIPCEIQCSAYLDFTARSSLAYKSEYEEQFLSVPSFKEGLVKHNYRT